MTRHDRRPTGALATLTLVGLLGLLGLTACGSSAPPVRQAAPPVSPVATSSAPAATVPPSGSPSPGPNTTVGTLTFFTTPTGNIACAIGPGAGARCDVQDHTWQAPRKPDDCDLDYGDSLFVGTAGAGFGCVGDTVRDPSARVLPYGATLTSDGIHCLSETAGLTCAAGTGTGGPGFTVSKAAYRLF